jgi:hypothetical protein
LGLQVFHESVGKVRQLTDAEIDLVVGGDMIQGQMSYSEALDCADYYLTLPTSEWYQWQFDWFTFTTNSYGSDYYVAYFPGAGETLFIMSEYWYEGLGAS